MLAYAELSEIEQRVWDGFATGAHVDLRPEDARAEDPRDGAEDPCDGAAWGAERTVRAAALHALLTSGTPGALRLTGARITGRLDLADTAVPHALTLTGCHFEQPVMLRGAQLRSTGLVGCRLPGLDGWLLRVDGNLFFEDSVIDGRLTLTRAHITGELRLSGVRLTARELVGTDTPEGPDGPDGPAGRAAALPAGDVWALWAGGLVMEGGLFGRHGLTVRGGLRLVGAQLGGGLFLEGAELHNPCGDALSGEDLSTGTMMLSDGFRAHGPIRLPGATVRSRLSLHGAVLDGGRPTGGDPADLVALDAQRLKAGELRLTPAATPTGAVDLQEAQVTVLHDHARSWPADSRLDGFTYTSIHPDGDAGTLAHRLDWLAALPGYAPQPYEQLAAWYRKIGHDDDARRVLLAKQRRRRHTLGPAGRAWGRLLDATVGYGYRPWQAGLWLLLLTALGTALFSGGGQQSTQSGGGSGTPFNPLVYTLDLLVPIGGFGQRSAWYWTDYRQTVGYLLVAAGWVLTTAAVAGITRALNRN
ncbi:oxidoreductase [Kitasatospora sp. NPDC088391]|uniref:oxidoreductase n=1 Tax=Kitasatospora sp. NPDC088391 TaxID=3364074 RepID=UPI003824843E